MNPPTEESADHRVDPRMEISSGPRQGLPAWLLSIVVHASLLVAFSLLAPSASPPPGQPERIVGIALVAHDARQTPHYLSGETSGSGAGTAPDPKNSVSAPGAESLQQLVSESGLGLPAVGDLPATSGGSLGLPSAQSLTAGASGQGQGVAGGQARTQIFGAQGVGSEFVYVFDRSASMGGFGGRPLAAAKRELLRSLNDLTSVNQFQIVFYNESPAIFNPFRPAPPKMFGATDENKRLAEQYVQSINAVGGTDHRNALEFALRTGSDVIFFLTDADEPGMTANQLADLRRRNRSATIIHTIEFGAGPFSGRNNFLVQIARQHGGQHVYVDVAELPQER